MRDKGMISDLSDGHITVIPLISDACISCSTQGCAKQGKPFEVDNPKGFDLNKGLIVKVGCSPLIQGIQSVIALFLPILCSVFGYILSDSLAQLTGLDATEGFKAFTVLLFLVVSCLIVYVLSKTILQLKKPEILQTF